MKKPIYFWQLCGVVVSALFFSGATILLIHEYIFNLQSVVETSVTSQPFAYQLPIVLAEQLPPPSIALPVLFSAITFTGDIMLARSVELSMKGNGSSYPFKNVLSLVASSAAVVANFESAIPRIHIQTPPTTMRFSVDPTYVPELRESGITHVSLANNHSLDYGQLGYENTVRVLTASGLVPFGHSTTLSTSSITYIQVGSTTVSILAIHTLFVSPSPLQLSTLIAYMKATSDIQLAYIHWGTEYQLVHDTTQMTLANYLVALGIDGIIGHHPHVVEDIQLVNNVPVFYSLGNFIFDQYFSEEVQKGLLVRLEITETELIYHLLPVTSLGSRSQPRLMTEIEQSDFLTKLAARSAPALSSSIKAGKLIFPRGLAVMPKNSII